MIVLLERDQQIAMLVDLLEQADQGRGSLALVAGEAGVGKTSLVKALAAQVRNRSLVLTGACDPLSTPRPLSPLLDIAADPNSGLEDIDVLAEQHGIFTTFLDRLRKSLRPVLVIIEDIHWADDATIDLLRFVGRRVSDSKALVVLTFREHEVGRNNGLQVMLGDLAAAGTPIKVAVPPLSPEAVRTLSAGRGFDPEHLHRITGGNAFFVTEVIAAGQFVPASVRDAVLARVLRLGERAQRVVEAVSIAPRAFELDKALRLAGAHTNDVDEAVSRGVLVAEKGRLRFRHELARAAVEDAILPARREMLHRKMIDLLVEARIDDPARLAHHASNADDEELIVRYALPAAEDAASRGAHREAIRFYEAALAFAGRLDDAAQIRLKLAEQLYVVDRQAEALQQSEMALIASRGSSDLVGTARALARMSAYAWTSGDTAASRPLIDEAVKILEPEGDEEELARALYYSAHTYMLARHHRLAIEHGQRSLKIAEAVNSRDHITRATIALGTTELVTGDPDRGLELLQRARLLSEEVDNKRGLMVVLGMVGSGGGEVRRYQDAEGALHEAISLGKAWDEDYQVAYSTAWLARIRFEQGRWDEATLLAREVDAGSGQGRAPISWITARTVLGRVAVRRGEPIGIKIVEEVCDQAKGAELQHRWSSIAGLAEYRWLIGARDRIAEVVEGPFSEAMATDSSWAQGELGFWVWRAGLIESAPENSALPYALQMDGQWRQAATTWQEIGCPYERAMALADGDEAAMLESLEILDQLGAQPLASLVRKKLRERGTNYIPRGPRAVTKADKAGLTPRQREVLDLMANGLNNSDIAARLYLTKKTVEHHVSAILQKIGVDSRAKAVAAAKDGGVSRSI